MEKEARRSTGRPRSNQKPEFEFGKLVDQWFSANGWSMSRIESKAVYNFAAGRYDHGQAEAGFSDRVGITPYRGVAAFVELKAPGQRSRIRRHQRDFLLSKIDSEAFAVCVDSIESLERIFHKWRNLRQLGFQTTAQDFLRGELPAAPPESDHFDDLLGQSEP